MPVTQAKSMEKRSPIAKKATKKVKWSAQKKTRKFFVRESEKRAKLETRKLVQGVSKRSTGESIYHWLYSSGTTLSKGRAVDA